MQYNFYSSLKTLAQTVVILLLVGIALDILNIFVNAIQLAFYPNMGTSENFSQGELILGLLAVGVVGLNFFVYIGTVVVFLMWLYRAYKNLTVFSDAATEASPGWAVGYWFIPFINLYKPLKIVNEVWHSSERQEGDSGMFSYTDTSSPSLHIFWWITWLASNILANVGTRIVFGSENNDVINAGTVIVIASSLFSMIAAVLLIKIVRNITDRQEANSARISFQPPPPPTFNQFG